MAERDEGQSDLSRCDPGEEAGERVWVPGEVMG